MGRFYITTPIYYVNDKPHVGHAYTTIAADVLARYRRLRGDDVVFLTGTDENSQKTVEAAQKSGEDIRSYTDRLAEIWKSTWRSLGISNTDFIRTTEARHRKTVEAIWQSIWEKGDIYKGKYEGLYCGGHEAFMKESDLMDGLCPDHKTKPERIVEEDYFFKLSSYKKKLLDFYEANPEFVTPPARMNEVRSFVEQGLEDISISRETQKWGIPVPNDPKQVIYVWFDALINYISAVGLKGWQDHPADVHMIGKDIVRFHAVIWPAMLMSAGLALPKQVVTNGFFTIDGVKISKSLGNAIDPLALAEKYGNDALRYFLLREIPYGEDGDFSEAKLKERYNADLANGLGNLVSRVMKMAVTYGVSWEDYLGGDAKFHNYPGVWDPAYSKFDLRAVIDNIWEKIQALDVNIQLNEPYKKVKTDETSAKKDIAYLLSHLLRISYELEPLLPKTALEVRRLVLENKIPQESLFPRLG